MDEESTVESSAQSRTASLDVVSLVAALIFAAAGAIVLAGESLADVDPVVLVGAVLIAIGAARFVAVPVRSRARRRARQVGRSKEAEPPDEQVQEHDQDQIA
ncbi:MAG: hypothetical protein OXB92_16200 [Acidimicrobiaceae bacterium]|nr:hypothetical protein [Acidimicrobiia bacterium]MCY4495388.1 hypothetical protein [Acidimicrobiaceae bacterium]